MERERFEMLEREGRLWLLRPVKRTARKRVSGATKMALKELKRSQEPKRSLPMPEQKSF